jgi:hypothetical protein
LWVSLSVKAAQACGYVAGVEQGSSDGQRGVSEARVNTEAPHKKAGGAYVLEVVVEVVGERL